jgi:hypothetical protein
MKLRKRLTDFQRLSRAVVPSPDQSCGPKDVVFSHLDELDGNADTTIQPADAAFDDVVDTQFVADFPDSFCQTTGFRSARI